MTGIERLADLRTELRHLERVLANQDVSVTVLENDRSLHNDVLFSLLKICQGVIDVAGEIASRHGLPFQDYTEAVRALRRVPGFTLDLVAALEPLPAFRNIVIHEYTKLDYGLVVEALSQLERVHEFIRRAAAELGAELD